MSYFMNGVLSIQVGFGRFVSISCDKAKPRGASNEQVVLALEELRMTLKGMRTRTSAVYIYTLG